MWEILVVIFINALILVNTLWESFFDWASAPCVAILRSTEAIRIDPRLTVPFSSLAGLCLYSVRVKKTLGTKRQFSAVVWLNWSFVKSEAPQIGVQMVPADRCVPSALCRISLHCALAWWVVIWNCSTVQMRNQHFMHEALSFSLTVHYFSVTDKATLLEKLWTCFWCGTFK